MSAVKRVRPARHLALVEGVRGFRLIVTAGRGETFGVTLEETYGESGGAIAAPVTTTTPVQTGRVVDAVFVAIRNAGHQPSVLAFKRKAPVHLGEAEGVRLALVMIATQPIAKHERVRALVAGINAMSVEETYYWYAKCMGLDGNRARKALRILLSDH
ncbi:hypothetical protein DC31_17195 [Microbacterium sp. CH12i]|uniref:DUF7680 family protein n=1 Tax=Microbacterium sp. CH12i TaxID=1479651 RepID=UPI000461E712|nr:hypothetical protein [Microbacterium sp. CH12i]KDA05278.1 hypothetical protein DC31_17195 [Microbacterium sp. CH12i]